MARVISRSPTFIGSKAFYLPVNLNAHGLSTIFASFAVAGRSPALRFVGSFKTPRIGYCMN